MLHPLSINLKQSLNGKEENREKIKKTGRTELFYFFLENPKQISNSNIPISPSCF